MSPFGTSFGGPLDDSDIDAIVDFLRSWEADPPVELPPEIPVQSVALEASAVYSELCAQCHGPEGKGSIGPSLAASEFQSSITDPELFDSINLGHSATAMIGWGEVLNSDQIQQMVTFIRGLSEEPAAERVGAPSFGADVLPILAKECVLCHGVAGGWEASGYEAVMTTGNNAPVVVPGDPESSLLAHKLLDTQEQGAVMPPSGALSSAQIQVILDWIAAGALDD
jgi:mono/diheme cytochrome c family protein